METDEHVSLPSREAIESVENSYNAIHIRFPRAVAAFESRWMAWHEECLTATTTASLDACAQTESFEALKRLGPKIIPFVVYKLATDPDQNSSGVLLYNSLEKDIDYHVKPDELLVSKETLQRHSNQIVELNHQRNKIVEALVAAWKEHHLENRLQSSSCAFTNCEEYWDLLEMGPSIIAHLMVEYMDDQYGYWWELMHETVHGRKMGAYMYQKGVLFEECRQFFNEGDHDQAPKYIPTEWDRFIYTGEMGPQVRDHFRNRQ